MLGVILATALGTAVGVARLSSNWIVSRLALAYVEFFRNVPLLVQLLLWLFTMLALPSVREGFVLLDRIYINNSGVSFPGPSGAGGTTLAWLAFVIVAALAFVVAHRLLTIRELSTGRHVVPAAVGVRHRGGGDRRLVASGQRRGRRGAVRRQLA